MSLSIDLDTLGTLFDFSAVYLFGMELSCLNTPNSQGGLLSLSIPKQRDHSPIISNSEVTEMFVDRVKWPIYNEETNKTIIYVLVHYK